MFNKDLKEEILLFYVMAFIMDKDKKIMLKSEPLGYVIVFK